MKVIQQIKKEGKLVYYFLQETFVWKYYGMMILLIILSIITNLSFSYSFSTILSGGLGVMKWWTSILLVFVCGKIACTVCGFLYSQLSLKFKMRLKELYLHRISDKLLKADYTPHSKENLSFFDTIQTLDNGRIKSTTHTSQTFVDNI